VIPGSDASGECPSSAPRGWFMIMVQVAVLRRGEICGLCRDDIDFETRTLRIGGSRVLAGGKIVVKESKSEHGYRTLPLKDTLMAAPARPVAKGGLWCQID
jgi:integrase